MMIDESSASRPALMDRSAQRCRQVHELVVSGDRLLDHPSDSAWLRIQACMAIPAATEALIDRADPYWAIE